MTSITSARSLGLAVAITVVGALTAPTAFAAPAAPAAPAKTASVQSDDFNGDGYRDVVTTTRAMHISGTNRPAQVAVVYGAKTAALHAKKQTLKTNRAGVPARPSYDFDARTATTSADLDRDGYADLVVGTPGEDQPGSTEREGSGALSVFWGGKTGLNPVPSVVKGNGGYLAAGDFDGDKNPDIATLDGGNFRVHKGPFQRSGAAASTKLIANPHEVVRDVAVGDFNGDRITDLVTVDNVQDGPSMLSTRFWKGTKSGLAAAGSLSKYPGGERVALGDINKDGFDDIVLGRPDRGLTDEGVPEAKGGRIIHIPGSAKGPVTAKRKLINQNSTGVPGTAVWGDHFGSDVAIADVNGDKYADVVVGAPGKDVGGKKDAGAVIVLRGAKTGLAAAGGAVFTQDTASVPGTAEKNDYFGGGLRLTDFNRDGRADLIAGADGEDLSHGAVWALKGSATGITAKGSVSFGPRVVGITPVPYYGFGLGFNH